MGVLLIRNKNDKSLRQVPSQPFSERRSEADLHSFLESDPTLIATGIEEGSPTPTTVVASHLRLNSDELDLLLLDINGEITIAELKKGRTSRDVIGQILDYASKVSQLGVDGLRAKGVDIEAALDTLEETAVADEYERPSLSAIAYWLQRPRLVIVSYEIDEATRRITDFLRTLGTKIYCIEFEYFEDEDREYYYPEIIGIEDLQRIEEKELTETQRRYRALWAELVERFKAQRPGVTRRSTSADSWLGLGVFGIGGIHLEWAIRVGLEKPDSWLGVEIHFEKSNKEQNYALVDRFTDLQEELEQEIGEKLVFQKKWGKRWSRIYARKGASRISEDLKNWAVDTMVKFYDAFGPRLKEIE